MKHQTFRSQIYQTFQEAKTEPVVIDTLHAALDDLPLNLYADPWATENHHNEFSLANPNDLSLDQSGTSGYHPLTYVNEPVYQLLEPSAGTSTGGGTSQNHTSNQEGFQTLIGSQPHRAVLIGCTDLKTFPANK